MLTLVQINTMLKLQNAMNEKVNPQWLDAGYAYLRAAMMESVEAIDHHGWKWWKAQHKDLPQLQMEMIDIWHFALSDYLIKHKGNLDAAANDVVASLEGKNTLTFDGTDYDYKNSDLLANLQLMTGLCAANRFSSDLFMQIATQCELSGTTLYEQYVGKNVLNFFRQDNGYKDGSYIKVWNGKEDNEHLVEVLSSLDINADDYSDLIYSGLAARYPK
ncbi:dUTP diphosphatase [Alteromonas sp. 5E99-2]|uniref:dUTP diphosphatase n=1 Tax=Alteromonas sp. 5E99-2 TaxID=2817683 RepID=UPI001A97F33A|nr:dUTP diphosphatase [Alteromonas sp. 5E99-2]MBO1255630.1 dUTP diphosphatase [Alteromonas sp. 5E99-2]